MCLPSGEQSILSATPPQGVIRFSPWPDRPATKIALTPSLPGFGRRNATRPAGKEQALSPPSPEMPAGLTGPPVAVSIISRPAPTDTSR